MCTFDLYCSLANKVQHHDYDHETWFHLQSCPYDMDEAEDKL